MEGERRLTTEQFQVIIAVLVTAVLAGSLTIPFALPANALPSFARQTGQPAVPGIPIFRP